jgi:amidase
LLEIFLARVERLNPKLNAVITLDAEPARQRADEADRAFAPVRCAARCTACR